MAFGDLSGSGFGEASRVAKMVRVTIPLIASLATVLLIVGLYLSWRLSRNADLSADVVSVLPLLVLLGMGSYGFRFCRWHILVRRLAPRLPWLVSLRIYMAGFAMGLTPGRLGEFFKFTLLREASGVPEWESFTVFPLERATEAASFLILAVVGATIAHTQLQHIGMGSIAIIAILPLLTLVPLIVRLMQRRHRATSGSRSRFDAALRGLGTVARARALLPALLCALLARTCDSFLVYSAMHAAGVGLSWPGAALAWGLAGLVGGLSLLPAGVGVVEASVVTTVVGLGGAAPEALAGVILTRLMTLWIWIPAGLIFAFRGVARRPGDSNESAVSAEPAVAASSR